MDTKLVIKKGKDLKDEELLIINSWRKKEFNSKSLIQPKDGNDDWEKLYFLLKNNNANTLAFGRLHKVNLVFHEVSYNILGLATLIAIEKGKGFGKRLVVEMVDYIKLSGRTGIGFCNKKLREYYHQCGLGIIEDGVSRFLYKNDNGELLKDRWGGGDVIYVEGKDNLIYNLLENKEEKVIIYREHW